MGDASPTKQGPAGLPLLVGRHPQRTPFNGEAPRGGSAHAAAVAVGPAITAKGAADVKTSAAAAAAGRLPTRRVRALLRVTADRVPPLAVVPSPVPSLGPLVLLEVGDGVLGVTAPEAINVGRISAPGKERVIMARRPTNAGTGVITTDGGAPGDATPIRVASLRPVLPKAPASREEARDPSKGTPCAARLVPRLLRVLGATLDAEAIKAGPLLERTSARHRHEADGAKALLGPAAPVQVTGGEAEGAINEARARPAALVVPLAARPLLAVGAVLRRIAGEGRVVANASLEEATRNDPVDQPTAEATTARMGAMVLEEGGRGLGRIGPRPRPWLIVVKDPRPRRPSDVP